MAEKKRISTTIDADVWEKAKAKRRQTGRTLAHVIETALRKWVEDDPPAVKEKGSTA